MADDARRMRTFLIECFAPAAGDGTGDGAGAGGDLLRDACADLRALGSDIDYLGALVVPHDELAFHVFVATDIAVVQEAGQRAGVSVERVVESVAIGPPPSGRIVMPGISPMEER